jgi:CubicO group peptidase (beta-lactamase class C family)
MQRIAATLTIALTLVAALAAAETGSKAGPAAEPLTWENLEARLEAEARAGFAGSVLIVRDGKTVLDRGYGLANRELGIPIGPDTLFATGSLPIDYTHAAILWLAQNGKLKLTDPITSYFESVPADKRAITIEHLMTGASGLPDFHDLPSDRDPDHSWVDRDEAMRRIFAQKLLFEPGDGDEHSHSAWGVLAAIVEIASGKSYQEFTREHLFGPAGMADTGFNGDPVPEKRMAIGYGMRSDGETNAPPWWGKTSWLVLGSGGQIGTTRDTGRWIDAMREGKILEPEWAERFFGPGVGASRNGDAYGYEMFVYHSPGAESYAVTLTNSNKPEPGKEDDTPFIRLSREIGNLLLEPYLPRYVLGIGIDPGPDGTVLVSGVGPGSAAERDGFREGDLLVSAGGVPLADDPGAVLDPYLQSGKPIVLKVRREGKELEITVKPDPR